MTSFRLSRVFPRVHVRRGRLLRVQGEYWKCTPPPHLIHPIIIPSPPCQPTELILGSFLFHIFSAYPPQLHGRLWWLHVQSVCGHRQRHQNIPLERHLCHMQQQPCLCRGGGYCHSGMVGLCLFVVWVIYCLSGGLCVSYLRGCVCLNGEIWEDLWGYWMGSGWCLFLLISVPMEHKKQIS